MSNHKFTKVEIICEVCKKSFLVVPSRAKRQNTRFCSWECRKSTRVGHACKACGSIFFVKKSLDKRSTFCSFECKDNYTTPLLDRFANCIGKKTESGCLEWTGTICKGNGYGSIGIWSGRKNNKRASAHRVAWELMNGPIPDGLCVLHKCDNRICVNVDHLFLGTNIDNISDMVSKGRQSKGESHRNSKLSTEDVRSIRERYALGGIYQYELAKEFGVTQTTISCIVLGKSRKNG